jgi:hypothetical protein
VKPPAAILAIEDEHERWAAYRQVIASVAAAEDRTGDRALVATILRDPADLVAKSAVVELVDAIALKTTDPAEFRRWTSGLAPELDRLADAHREFVWQRVRDWTLHLTIETGHAPTAEELNAATNFMQRFLADRSTSRATLDLLGEMGRTKKIRNIAKNRRDVR